jgi:hypothetical protein
VKKKLDDLYRHAIAKTIAYSRQGKKKPTRSARVFHYTITAGIISESFVGTRTALFDELNRIMTERPSVKTFKVESDDGKSKFTIRLGG